MRFPPGGRFEGVSLTPSHDVSVPKHTKRWSLGIRNNAPVPSIRRLSSRTRPLGLAFAAIQLWSRLTPEQRRQLIDVTRTHGPTVARAGARRVGASRKKAPL